MGCEIHDEIIRKGLMGADVDVGNALVDMYSKFGFYVKVKQVFDSLPVRDEVSWNAILLACTEHGHGEEALQYFEQMQSEGIPADAISLGACLKACTCMRAWRRGQVLRLKIHGGPFEYDIIIGTVLIDFYAKCGSLDRAHELFDNFVVKDKVTWNTLISGYADQGDGESALKCFEFMQLAGVNPNAITFLCSLKACGIVRAANVEMGCEIHDEIIRKGLMGADVDVGNALVDMYSKFGFYVKVKQVFDSLPVRDEVSWNAILLACTEHGHGEEALQYFEQMQSEGIPADAISLGACQVLRLKIHGGPFEYDIIIGTVLIDFYAKCGSLDRAHELFDNFMVKDKVTWNTLISGYADQGDGESALKCFEFMQLAGVNPNAITFLCSLKACGIVRAANVGMQIHAEICRRSLLNRELIGNTLVNLTDWKWIFFAEALDCYEKMQHEGVLPNSVTYVLSLKTCAIIGRLGILVNNLAVSNALIDMYAKSGLIPMAQEIFDHLSHRGVACFNSLIARYAHLGDNVVVFILLDKNAR
ncbi:hypothetical protein KP509_32G057100 [Ceratopteris richardii]|uniref:Pentatricopeptide repeat-containing protein n=1 Tax=Ceratopteris richardii TaxID=49495 RepID=A0A8T2QTM3_CERRI|nr:hypothetical protein KP509_32G057100 [Ceratopteris richardii]